MSKFAVVENPGQDNQKIVYSGSYTKCRNYLERACYESNYSDDEFDLWNTDIMKYNSDGSLTTEY